ncbi:MAG: arylsulfatase [Bacteroidetes bacterium]|nr:arylsulfatase [Bacteroidota bacterium]
MRITLLAFLPFCLLAFLPSCKESQPNVILIMTDDQGYGDIGAHGSPYVKTPAMDKLHDQSVCLVNFHVDPCCAPTRSALLTGQYSSRTGVWHTIGGRSLLGTDNVTMAEVFRDAGYKTAIFGKWHLGENYPFRPMDRGFEESLIHGGGAVGANPDYASNDYYDDTYIHNGVREQYSGYCNTVWFTEAMKYIKKNRDNPFFCYVSTNVPHAPLLVDSAYSEPYKSMVSERLANYYGMIAKVDEDLGIFIHELDNLDLADNTILIFMTDNGPCPWFGGIIIDENGFVEEGYSCDMRGGKIWGYENAHRVPCFIRWPDGDIGGGTDISKLTAHIDLLPSLIDWCGLETPSQGDFDGISLRNLIQGNEDNWPDRTLFVHNQRVDFTVKYKEYQVLTEQWRLLNRDTLELYDILDDQGQTKNLVAEYPDVVQKLTAQYEDWWEHISTNFDQFNPIIVGNEKEDPSMLYSHDAHRPKGEPAYWVVDVEKEGEYDIQPYFRPKETGKTLKGSRISKGFLSIGDEVIEKEVQQGAETINFKIKLSSGQTKVSAWFQRDGKDLRSYSLEVEKIGNLPM